MTAIPEICFGEETEARTIELVKASGVVKVTGITSREELTALNREFESILAEGGPGVRDLGVEGGDARDVARHQLDREAYPDMIRFFTQPWMQRLSDLYWRDERILNDHIFVTREVPGTKHLAQDLHFDVQETLKFFLYLNDVTAENGAFSCVPGSLGHSRKVREENGGDLSYEKRDSSRQHPFSESEIVPVEAAAGTLIVFTTEVWHRAGLVRSGERRVMRGHTRTPIEGAVKQKRARNGEKAAERIKVKKGWMQRLFNRDEYGNS